MLEKIHIRNFKSILDEEISLGAFNVFIGQNGCGKTNVLEAVGMVAAAVTDRLTTEDLGLRGLRVARPNLMVSAFGGVRQDLQVSLVATFPDIPPGRYLLVPRDGTNHLSRWVQKTTVAPPDSTILSETEEEGGHEPRVDQLVLERTVRLQDLIVGPPGPGKTSVVSKLLSALQLLSAIGDYAIFAPSTNTLRGLEVTSRRDPLGLYGENLDITLSRLPKPAFERLKELTKLVDWVDEIQVDETDHRKFEGLKLGRSLSRLYFSDRFMADDNRTFSAENANEGILHVLFHLVLFLSDETPKLFAIDNIETALNPGMCRRLTSVLAKLAVEKGKQALVTTHNPAILDGLNLHDDQQRLFVVYRNDDGHTKVKRVKMKPENPGGLKLSELWLRGHLGALPQDF